MTRPLTLVPQDPADHGAGRPQAPPRHRPPHVLGDSRAGRSPRAQDPASETAPASASDSSSVRAWRANSDWVFRSWRPAPRRGSVLRQERGAVTAEYAIVILAAVAFAGLLVAILRSDEIRAMLVELVRNALNATG